MYEFICLKVSCVYIATPVKVYEIIITVFVMHVFGIFRYIYKDPISMQISYNSVIFVIEITLGKSVQNVQK